MSRANENKPPLPIEWAEEYGCKVPTCPACGDITDSVEPCPHCGEQASIEQAALGSKKYLVWWVRCKLCGATTASHSSEQDAVKAWNRRTYGKS